MSAFLLVYTSSYILGPDGLGCILCFYSLCFLFAYVLLRLSGSDHQEAPPGSRGSALLSVSNNGAGSCGTRDPVSLLKCSPLGTLCTFLHRKMKPVPEQQEVCPLKSLRRFKFRAQSLFTVRFILSYKDTPIYSFLHFLQRTVDGRKFASKTYRIGFATLDHVSLQPLPFNPSISMLDPRSGFSMDKSFAS